jgi:hypothetical protein
MFGQTIKTVLKFKADGTAESVVSSEKLTVLNGTIAALTAKLTNDQVVTGIGATLCDLALIPYATAQATRKMIGLEMALNPFTPA